MAVRLSTEPPSFNRDEAEAHEQLAAAQEAWWWVGVGLQVFLWALFLFGNRLRLRSALIHVNEINRRKAQADAQRERERAEQQAS